MFIIMTVLLGSLIDIRNRPIANFVSLEIKARGLDKHIQINGGRQSDFFMNGIQITFHNWVTLLTL